MKTMNEMQQTIESFYEKRAEVSPGKVDPALKRAIDEALEGLDNGSLRVAEKLDGKWQVNEWLKKAVLLSFRVQSNEVMESCYTKFYDKVPPKFTNYTAEQFAAGGFRVGPPAAANCSAV
jgi:2,3,4,5-tetrahydropyridine-2-carboxylate N-succinyltransferase